MIISNLKKIKLIFFKNKEIKPSNLIRFKFFKN